MPEKLPQKKTLGHPVILYQDGKPTEQTFIYGRISGEATDGRHSPVEVRVFGRPRVVQTPEGHEFKVQGSAIRTTSDFDEEELWGPILARVMLGREMYEDIDLSATERDMELARSIISEITHALLSGERAVLDRLPDVEHAIHGRPTNETERLATYRESFAYDVSLYRAVLDGALGMAADEWLQHSITLMADRHDPAFRKLAPHQLDKAYRSVSEKKGPRETGPLRAAAEIAVQAEAFGTKKTADFGADVQRMMSRMRKATNDAKRGAAAKRALQPR